MEAPVEQSELSKEPSLTLLHISDLHFGQHIAAQTGKGTAHFDKKLVTQELLKDVTKLANGSVKPDWILVTGDIAFSGQASEYALARTWLENLTKALGLGHERVLIVPGNHDGDRKAVLDDFVASVVHAALRNAPTRLSELLTEGKATQLQTTLWPKLVAYADFAAQFGAPKLTHASPFWTLPLETSFAQPVFAIGLNSCLLSYDGEDAPSNLALGLGQLERAFREIPPGALLLVMAHHPPEWLADGAPGQHKDAKTEHTLTSFLQKHPHLLFVGHVHQQGGLATQPLHTGGLLRFVAGAGHEAAHEGGRHAYAWVRIHGGGIDFYPRMWYAEGQSFQPEANRFKLEKGEEYHRVPRVKLPDLLEKWLEPRSSNSSHTLSSAQRGGASTTQHSASTPGIVSQPDESPATIPKAFDADSDQRPPITVHSNPIPQTLEAPVPTTTPDDAPKEPRPDPPPPGPWIHPTLAIVGFILALSLLVMGALLSRQSESSKETDALPKSGDKHDALYIDTGRSGTTKRHLILRTISDALNSDGNAIDSILEGLDSQHKQTGLPKYIGPQAIFFWKDVDADVLKSSAILIELAKQRIPIVQTSEPNINGMYYAAVKEDGDALALFREGGYPTWTAVLCRMLVGWKDTTRAVKEQGNVLLEPTGTSSNDAPSTKIVFRNTLDGFSDRDQYLILLFGNKDIPNELTKAVSSAINKSGSCKE